MGFDFSQDFSSGLSDHFGVNEGLGLCLLKNWMVLNVTPAVLESIQSKDFQSWLLAVFGIKSRLSRSESLRGSHDFPKSLEPHGDESP